MKRKKLLIVLAIIMVAIIGFLAYRHYHNKPDFSHGGCIITETGAELCPTN